MMRARISTLIVALAVGLAVATTATGQARTREKADFAITGEITAIDSTAKTLTLQSTNDQGLVYAVNDTTTLMSGADKLTFGDLRRGDKVVVNGHDNGDTRLITYLKVVKAP